jgi:septum formation protein
MEPVILASSSPQRTAILRELNIPFQVVLPDFAESAPEGMPEEKVAEFLAAQKVRSVIKMYPPEQEIRWALGADTVIALEGKFYGKPQDADEAASFLRAFSGKTQTVYTSIALYKGETKSLTTRTSKSAVTFKTLSEDELDWYLQTAEWL